MTQVKGLIFDLDGTLGDTLPLTFNAYREALAPYSDKLWSNEDIEAIFGPSEEGILRQVVGDDQGRQALERYQSFYEREHERQVQPIEGLDQVLRECQNTGLKLAIVTGKTASIAQFSLEKLELLAFFDPIETGSPDGNVKRECLQRVISQWRLAPSELAYVGDAPSDIEISRAMGLRPLAVGWASQAKLAPLREAEPDGLFTTVGEFQDWIRENCPVMVTP